MGVEFAAAWEGGLWMLRQRKGMIETLNKESFQRAALRAIEGGLLLWAHSVCREVGFGAKDLVKVKICWMRKGGIAKEAVGSC